MSMLNEWEENDYQDVIFLLSRQFSANKFFCEDFKSIEESK